MTFQQTLSQSVIPPPSQHLPTLSSITKQQQQQQQQPRQQQRQQQQQRKHYKNQIIKNKHSKNYWCCSQQCNNLRSNKNKINSNCYCPLPSTSDPFTHYNHNLVTVLEFLITMVQCYATYCLFYILQTFLDYFAVDFYFLLSCFSLFCLLVICYCNGLITWIEKLLYFR